MEAGADGVLRKDGEAFEVTALMPQGMRAKDLEVTQSFQGFLGRSG